MRSANRPAHEAKNTCRCGLRLVASSDMPAPTGAAAAAAAEEEEEELVPVPPPGVAGLGAPGELGLVLVPAPEAGGIMRSSSCMSLTFAPAGVSASFE